MNKDKRIKTRKSNFELMKILSMYFIVIWHYIIHAHVLDRTSGTLNLFINFIFIVLSIHVNSFVLCTGYFQYKGDFKKEKVITLIKETWFYKASYAIIFLLFFNASISKIDLFFFLQPINYSYSFGEFYWFINVYILLYLLTPFLNKMIKSLSQQMHKRLILILIVTLSIIPYITLNQVISNTGYTISHFVMMYIIGSYLGKYPLHNNWHFKNYSDKKYRLIIILLFICSIIITFLGKPVSEYLSQFNNDCLTYISRVIGGNIINFSSPFVIVESIMYLLLFETFDFKNVIINKIATLIFGIYLVHENAFVYNNLYQFLPFGTSGEISSKKIILCIIFISLAIFIASATIEWLRQKLFCLVKYIIAILKPNKKSCS